LRISYKEALNKDILIHDQYFTIVGVITDPEASFLNIKIGVIPISTAQQKITADPYYPYLIFETDKSIPSSQAIKLIKYTLLKRQ
jgi:hypothetical protein